MTEYDNTNRGVLFKNEKKQHENQPDYTGKVNVNGLDLRLSAWIKTSKAGNKFMSLAVSEMQAGRPQSNQPQAAPQGGDFDDDIPFNKAYVP